MAKRFIDAEMLKDDFCEHCVTHKRYHLTVEQCRAKEQPTRKWCFKMRLIDNTPTADVVEVRHGEWIWTENGEADYEQYWVCSVCGEKSYIETKYCSDCGAKMDKVVTE